MEPKANVCFIHGMKLKHNKKYIQNGPMGPKTQNKFWTQHELNSC